MLIRYSVENFLSFNQRAEFSMIPGRGSLKANHRSAAVNGVQTLRTAIILGANASGKSNLIKAISFGKSMVVKGYPADRIIDFPQFKLDTKAESRNSRMEFEIQAGGKNYVYGFVFNRTKVVEEWLYEISKRSEKAVFERDSDRETVFNLDALMKANPKEEDRQFIRFTAKGTPDNQLFLRELIVRRVADNVHDISDITTVYNWFLNTLKVIFPEDKYKFGVQSEINDNARLNSIYAEFFKYFDTKISGICLEDIDIDSSGIPGFILADVKENLMNPKSEGARSILSVNGSTYVVTREESGMKFQKLKTKHLNDEGKEILGKHLTRRTET